MEKEELKLIAKYLSGNISDDERSELYKWIELSQKNKAELEELSELWEYSDQQYTSDDMTTGKEWLKLKKHLQEDEGKKSNFFTSLKSLPREQLVKRAYYMAAALVLFVTFGSLVKFSFFNTEQPVLTEAANISPETTRLVAEASVEDYYLPDGTHVWLDTGSILSFNDEFGKEERKVNLVGHAFFEVSRDTSKRFVIMTNDTRTEVLGTSFDLKAVPGKNTVEVVVVTGKVMFSGLTEQEQDTVILYPTEKGDFNRDLLSLEKMKNENPDFLLWKNAANPDFVVKKAKPKRILNHHFSWKKNILNQTVIEGEITNATGIDTYHRLRLKVSYFTKKKGEIATEAYIINGPVGPGETISYKKVLLKDWLRNTSDLKVEIEKVERLD